LPGAPVINQGVADLVLQSLFFMGLVREIWERSRVERKSLTFLNESNS